MCVCVYIDVSMRDVTKNTKFPYDKAKMAKTSFYAYVPPESKIFDLLSLHMSVKVKNICFLKTAIRFLKTRGHMQYKTVANSEAATRQ